MRPKINPVEPKGDFNIYIYKEILKMIGLLQFFFFWLLLQIHGFQVLQNIALFVEARAPQLYLFRTSPKMKPDPQDRFGTPPWSGRQNSDKACRWSCNHPKLS